MGCCTSIPHSQRRYRDPVDLDEVIVPIREFGNFRNGSNLVPNDIDGLPSTHILHRLATESGTLLYEAEIDQGRAFRCIRPILVLWLCPPAAAYIVSQGLSKFMSSFTCDEACCWLRKEYSTRTFFRVYPNRIVVNDPLIRIPFGFCGCGSWNADVVKTHPFDRGAFGFRSVRCGVINLLCCTWPVYGQVVARQRCPCNGPLWNRMGDCGGWWCDEWLCDTMFCVYRYYGIADADETSCAASIALQAYFEGRQISKEDMDQCLEYWRTNVSERGDPENRKRDVCCEPYCIPTPSCQTCHQYLCHPKRNIPYPEGDERRTEELVEVYEKYEELRQKQVEAYKEFYGPVRHSTMCQQGGCRRLFGRRGFIFCTEGCTGCRKPGDPAPSFEHRGIDDENDAATILQKVLGDPPVNVSYTRWRFDEETGEATVVTIPDHAEDDNGKGAGLLVKRGGSAARTSQQDVNNDNEVAEAVIEMPELGEKTA